MTWGGEMAEIQVPEPTISRLSLYHCFLIELIRLDASTGITSRTIADELGLTEETVRRDLSYLGSVGRPGAGYDPVTLLDELGKFLGLASGPAPIVVIGTAEMVHALLRVFPGDLYGIRPVAAYSELPEDAGVPVDELIVRHLSDIPRLDQSLQARVALVATSPGWAQVSIDLLAQAGVTGILLLTPILRVHEPEGVAITKLRMPCDLKSLTCRCQTTRATGAREA